MSCQGKRRFPTRLDAELRMARIDREGDDNLREKIPCRSYLCPRCEGWHLTSQPLRTRPGGVA